MLNRIYRHAIYAPLLATAMAIMLGRLLLFARLLEPNEFARLNVILIISGGFCMLSCLGLFLELQRKLPILLAKRRLWSANILFYQTVIVSLLLAILGFLLAAVGYIFDLFNPTIFVIGVAHGASQQLFMIATTESRSRGQTVRFSFQNVARAVWILLAAVPIALKLKDAAAILTAEAAATLLVSAVIIWRAHSVERKSLPAIHRLAIRQAGRISRSSMVALMAVTITAYMSTNVDRWLAVGLLSQVQFGQFAFVWTTMTLASAVQSLINASVFPLLARRYGNYGKINAFRSAMALSFTLLAASILLIWPAYAVAKWIVPAYYAQYVDGLPAIPFMAAAASFRVSDFASSFLIIAGYEKRALMCTVISMGAASFIWLTALATMGESMSITAAATLTVLLAALTFISTTGAAWHAARKTPS